MTERTSELLAMARAARASQQHHVALDLFRRVHQMDAESTEALNAIAELAASVGNDEEALSAKVELINHYICANKLDTAEKLADEVIKAAPDHTLVRRFHAFLKQRLNPEVAFDASAVPPPKEIPRGTRDFAEGLPAEVLAPPPAEPPPAEPQARDPFADIQTRYAPADVMRALRRDHLIEAAILEKDYPAIDDEWEARTTAIINAANLQKVLAKEAVTRVLTKPARQEFDAPIHTVALDGQSAVLAMAELVETSPLLAALDDRDRRDLLAAGDVVQCFADQVVVRQESPGSSLFLLLAGSVVLERSTEAGGVHCTDTVAPGDFFGEGAALGGTPHTATARLCQDSLLLEIERSVLKDLSQRNNQLLPVLGRQLRARLLAALLVESPLYRRLPDEARELVTSLIFLQKIRRGQLVIKRDEPFTGYSNVMAGALEVEGSVLERLGPGSDFGEGSLRSERSTATLRAVMPTWLLHMPTLSLRELLSRNADV